VGIQTCTPMLESAVGAMVALTNPVWFA